MPICRLLFITYFNMCLLCTCYLAVNVWKLVKEWQTDSLNPWRL